MYPCKYLVDHKYFPFLTNSIFKLHLHTSPYDLTMPPTAAKTNVFKSEAEERLMYIKSIQSVDASIKKLLLSQDDFKLMTEDGLRNVANKRSAANEAYESEMSDMVATKKRKVLEMDLDLERRQREGVVEILNKSSEEPILTSKRLEMEANIHRLQNENTDRVKDAEESVRKALVMQFKNETERLKLCHEKDQAMVTEQNKSLQCQLEQKDTIIMQMREDAVKLQALVQGVAEASNRPMSYMSDRKGRDARD